MNSFKLVSTIGILSAVAGASAASIVVTTNTFGQNAVVRSEWLGHIGISGGQYFADFEGLPLGSINNVANIYPNMTVSATSGDAIVTSGTGLLGTSNPIGLQALAFRESGVQTITFAGGVDYFAFHRIDVPNVDIVVTFMDNTTETYLAGGSGSSGNTAAFWGIYRNDRPMIQSIQLDSSTGDGEWGIDNLEYGAVPEPATMFVLGGGALALLRKKRKS